jgi:translocation and assembly module TamA
MNAVYRNSPAGQSTPGVTVATPGEARGCHLLLFLSLLLASLAVVAQPRVEVEISGVEGALLDNVRAHLGIAAHDRKSVLQVLTELGEAAPADTLSEAELRRLHQRARGEIRQALQPFGYYEPIIDARLKHEEGTWRARYRIDPGPATLVGSVDIRVDGAGREEPAVQQALGENRLSEGRQLHHDDYEGTKRALQKAALAAGYLDASYQRAELRILPDERRADVTLHLDTGSRYYFGPVTIEQDILDPDFVSGYIRFAEGEPFNTDKLLRLQLDLGDSGFYRRVEVQSRREEAVDYHIPVTIKTVPAKPRLYAWGLGYGTDTGPRISLGAVFRRINESGHSILADTRVSRVYRTIGLQYRVPIGNLVSDSLVYKASADFEDVGDEGNTDLYTLGISHNVEWGPFQRRLYAEFRYEDYDLGEDSEVTQNLIPGITLSQLRTDNVLFPRQGYSWSGDLRGAAGVISDTRFLRGRLDGRYVHPVGERGRVLLRSRLGATAVKDFEKLPASERFFAGGDQSVRGYGYQKLGPTDDSGDIVGGRFLTVGSVELDYLFAGDFGGALFVDTGNADDDFPPSLKTGAGVGLRWRSPVGMLRVDVAHPFVDSDDAYRLHISIGPEL